MDELLFSYDNEMFEIKVYEQYVNLRWKTHTSKISIRFIKIVVNSIKSLYKNK